LARLRSGRPLGSGRRRPEPSGSGRSSGSGPRMPVGCGWMPSSASPGSLSLSKGRSAGSDRA